MRFQNLCNVFQSVEVNLFSLVELSEIIRVGELRFCKCYINDAKRRNVFADVKSRSDEKRLKTTQICAQNGY